MANYPVRVQIPPFEDPNLLRTAQQYFHDISPDSAIDDSRRPIKRVRVSGIETDNLGFHGSSELAKIGSLFGLDVKTDFESLSKIIVYVYDATNPNKIFTFSPDSATQAFQTKRSPSSFRAWADWPVNRQMYHWMTVVTGRSLLLRTSIPQRARFAMLTVDTRRLLLSMEIVDISRLPRFSWISSVCQRIKNRGSLELPP